MKKTVFLKILFVGLFVITFFSECAISAVAFEENEFNYDGDFYILDSENDFSNPDENTDTKQTGGSHPWLMNTALIL